MQGDDVALCQQLLQRYIGEAGILYGIRVVCQNVHAEALTDADEDLSDLAGADDADGSAVEVEAHQSVEGEVKVPCAEVRLVNLAVQRQQQSHGELRHRIGRIAGNTHHRDASSCSVPIHVVVAGAAEGDHLDALLTQPVNDRAV